MGNFLNILQMYNNFFEINNDSDELNKFFGVLNRFNHGANLDR